MLGVTTESLEISPTSIKSIDHNEREEHSTIGQTAKLITSTDEIITMTPASLKHSNETSTTSSTTLAEADKSDTKVESDDPGVTTDAVTDSYESTESQTISSSTIASNNKAKDRSRVVSKDDIESIRGRALNLTNSERKQSTPGGVIYVTAPPPPPVPSMSIPKSAKTFSDDLSDVSMDNDSMDFQSSEHVGKTTTTSTTTPSISECKAEVRYRQNMKINFLHCVSILAIKWPKFETTTGTDGNIFCHFCLLPFESGSFMYFVNDRLWTSCAVYDRSGIRTLYVSLIALF